MSFSDYCLVQMMALLKPSVKEVMEMADAAESSTHTLLAVEIHWL